MFNRKFIVCKNLLPAVIIDLDFGKCFQVGIDWNGSGQLYLHQDYIPLTYLVHASLEDNSAIYSTDCTDARLGSKSNVFIPSQTIPIIPTKNTSVIQTSHRHFQI